MSSHYLTLAIIGCGISFGLISGVFLTFSDFAMKSLAAIDPFSGARAMQEINRRVYGSTFLNLFILMSIASLLMALYAVIKLNGLLAFYIISGGTLYFIGVFVVTIFGNVPMNKKLDSMEPSIIETQQYWKIYLREWTRLNHIRTVTSALSCAFFFAACLMLN